MIEKFESTGSVLDDNTKSGRPISVTTPENIEIVEEHFKTDPYSSTRRAPGQIEEANQVSMSRTSLMKIMKNHLDLFPYKIQLQQPLSHANIESRFEFANHMIALIEEKKIDIKRIHFTDEAYFHLDGYVNKQNYRYWGSENPHLTEIKSLHPVKVSVWAAISWRGIIGPFFISQYVDEHVYREEILEPFLEEAKRLKMVKQFWFQQDGATAHRTQDNFFLIASQFGDRIIGLDSEKQTGGGIDWPASSPELNVCDFFLWVYLKYRVYRTKPKTVEELKNRIREEFANIPIEIRERAIMSFYNRLHRVIESGGSHFQHLVH